MQDTKAMCVCVRACVHACVCVAVVSPVGGWIGAVSMHLNQIAVIGFIRAVL